MSEAPSAALLGMFSRFIAARLGLHFPQERWDDLARGLGSAAKGWGLRNLEDLAQRLLCAAPTRREIEELARHLTVGETYFFREKNSFDLLEQRVFPELLRRGRQGGKPRLRIWSAGCCTGEEPYSLAMLLDRMIPVIDQGDISILATDVNPSFLQTASTGVYGEWSFRAIPAGYKERYFTPLPDGKKWRIAERIRAMVRFAPLNLVEDLYPSPQNQTNALDLVICRNVLMYFNPEQAARVVGNLHAALVEGGWLLVAPAEASQVLFRRFETASFPETIYYRKPAAAAPRLPLPDAGPFPQPVAVPASPPPPADKGAGLRNPALAAPLADSPVARAQALANQGELAEALQWCDRAVRLEALNPAHRFLRAMVAQGLGMLEEARKSLQQALYLDQDFVMAHYALAVLAQRLGRRTLARRHFASLRHLLERLPAEALLPESAGLSAGSLREILRPALEGRLEGS